jgi:hypothetical protein
MSYPYSQEDHDECVGVGCVTFALLFVVTFIIAIVLVARAM